MSSAEHTLIAPEQRMGLRDRAQLLGVSTLASLAVFAPGVATANPTERAETAAPAAEAPVDTTGMSPEALQEFCITDALYSLREGSYVKYGRPDKKGRYFKIKQHVEADAQDPACVGVVQREIGVQQTLNGRPNTDYSVVSLGSGDVSRTVTQEGDRAWKCFKTFSQKIFITATTNEGFGGQKVFPGDPTTPNC